MCFFAFPPYCDSMLSIDFHVHSWISKDSSIVDSNLIISVLKRKRVSGFSLTDHNQWDAIPNFRKLCKENGMLFIPGCEIQTRDPKLGEILVYFSEEPLKSRNYLELCDEAKSAGCLVFLSHPFDLIRQNWVEKKRNQRNPLFINREFRNKIHGLEGINARNLILSSNEYAQQWASFFKVSTTGGSDAHSALEIGEAFGMFEIHQKVEKHSTNDHILEEIRQCLEKNRCVPSRFLNNHLAIHAFNVLKKYTSGLTQITDFVKFPLMQFGRFF